MHDNRATPGMASAPDVGAPGGLERMLSALSYDPATGDFTWLVTSGKGVRGSKAGAPVKRGHILLRYKGAHCYAHRLAWLIAYGAWPPSLIDHINGDPADNRLANLRLADVALNAENIRTPHHDNKSGYLGVLPGKAGNFVAQICSGGVRKHLGTFPTAIEAHTAYLSAKRRLHAGCTI